MAGQALIVVDMLNDFIDPDGALYTGPAAREIIPTISGLLETFRKQKETILFLADAHATDDREFESFPPHCVKGTWGSEVIPELTPLSHEPLIPKTRYSGFYNTSLATILTEQKITAATVVGVCTSICVMDTAGGLANRDIAITIPQNGVADFDPEFHRFALKRMVQLYGAQLS